MRITPLQASDLSAYKALMLHAYATAADAFTSTAAERAAEPDAWWLARIADPRGLTVALGAFLGTALVGTVTIEFSARPKTRHKAQVIGLFVHESARGRGTGRLLLQAALATAAARAGVLSVTLTVTEGNAAALALYEACGFTAFGTEPMAVATPTGFAGKVHLWRPLPRAAPVT
jgi:ribosomal protein S18 acetylase RimI-like enzyme